MPNPTQDGLLEQGQWDEQSAGSTTSNGSASTWLPARAGSWSLGSAKSMLRKAAMGHRTKQNKNLRRTAWLDGLRGFAAFMVYWGHHQLWAHNGGKIFENGWGYEGNYYLACFPIVRTFFTGGHYAVSCFFVISGYVLSNKPLQYMQSGEYLKLQDNLASAMFRRFPRLHIPIIVTTFIYFTIWHVFGVWTESVQERLFKDEVWKWYVEMKNFTFAFRTGGEPMFSYNFHIWSIPVEFRGSLIVYTALLSLSRATRNARLLCEVALIYYFMYIVDGYFGAMFMAGMLLCDLDMLAEKGDLPSIFSKLEPFKTPIYYTLFLSSLYLGGVPSETGEVERLAETPGWYYLSLLKPMAFFDAKWFYLIFAAIFLVAAIPRIWWLKSFFELPFNQYLGRISYGFYLVHGPVLWTLGNRLYSATGFPKESHLLGIPNWVNAFPLPTNGPMGFEVAFWVPQLILLPVTLWLAEVVTSTIDDPSVKFSAWLYKKVLGGGSPQSPQGFPKA